MTKATSSRGFLNLIITSFLGFNAQAAFTPDIGARASVAGAQELLVSPPIPDLEGGKTTVSPQIGYMTAKVDGSEMGVDPDSGTEVNMTYKGDIKGVSAAIGLSSPSSGRLGWFGIFGGDSLTGDIKVEMMDMPAGTVKDIKTQSFAFAAGPSYRFIGEAKSDFAAGIFFGPAAIKVKSTFTTDTNNTEYTLDDTIYGAYGGLQLKARVGSLVINPYALYMHELSPKCKKMTVSGSAMDFYGLCPGEPATANLVEMKSSFSGVGLFLGWNAFRLNVYSKSSNDSTFSDIKITNYSVSYTFGD